MKTDNALAHEARLSSLQRPLFSPGLLLEADDLTAGVAYTREMTRLLFRSLFGCGVICGLDVKGELICQRHQLKVTVDAGLALDGRGNPIHLTGPVELVYDPQADKCRDMPPTVWVVVCYTEKCCRPRDVSCSPDEDAERVPTRSADGYEVKLYAEAPPCACSCAKKPDRTPTRPRDGCCPDEDETTRDDAATGDAQKRDAAVEKSAAGGDAEHDWCACYRKHYDADSCTDCECACVLIAMLDTKVDTKDAPIDWSHGDVVHVKADLDVRRWIRPMLTGMCKCRHKKTEGGGR